MALPPVFLVPHRARLCPPASGRGNIFPLCQAVPAAARAANAFDSLPHPPRCDNSNAAMQNRKYGTPGTGPAVFRRLTEHAPLGRQAEQDLADGLEMDRPALALLRAGIHVAQPPLERVGLEDRGRSGGMIHGRDDVARLVDRPGCGEPQLDVLVGAEFALFLGLPP